MKKKPETSYEEKLAKYRSMRAKGIIAEMTGLHEPERDADDEDYPEDEVHLIEPGSEEAEEGVREAARILRSMYMAFFLISAVFLLIGLLIFKDRLKYAAGILTGVVTGCYYIKSLNLSVREVLNFDEKTAEKAMKKDARIRLLVVGAGGAAVCFFVGDSAVYGVLFEIFAIKLCAYLAPVLMKFSGGKK